MSLLLIAAVSVWVAIVALAWRLCAMAARADKEPVGVTGKRRSAA
jgi:hypothetical protein